MALMSLLSSRIFLGALGVTSVAGLAWLWFNHIVDERVESEQAKNNVAVVKEAVEIRKELDEIRANRPSYDDLLGRLQDGTF